MILLSAKTPKALLASDFEKIVDEYLKYFASGSSHTSRAKQLDLKDFAKFLPKHKGFKAGQKIKVSDWDHSSVQAFLEMLLDKGAAPASIARKLATLKHFGRTLADNVIGFMNPAKESKAPKTSLLRPKGLSQDDTAETVKNLLLQLENNPKFNQLRNATLLVFLLETGLRAEECRLLRMAQFSSDLEWIKNVRTKGRKFRNVYISSSLKPHLKKYLKRREQELKKFYPDLKPSQDSRLPVFISTYKAKAIEPDSFIMGAKTLWRSINELSKEFHLHPHLLRHSFALNLLESSKDVRLVSQALGHSDVRVTMRYTHRADEEMAKAVEEMSRKAQVIKVEESSIK